jgi:glycosyltransferase involved in cell wall biosynthesis
LAGKLVAAISFLRTFLCALQLVVLIKRKGIDVIHTNNTVRAVLITNLISRLTGVPYIYHAHSALHDHPVQKRAAREADCLLANSEYTATTYTPAGVVPEKCAVIYNGIDTEEFLPAYKSSKLRTEFKVSKSDILVGLIGRLTPSKGQEELVKAAPKVAAAVPNVKFIFVGDDSIFDNNEGYADRLRRMIADRRMDNRFIFTGFRRDLKDIYAALDVVLMPSNAPEGLGMVAIEGMAMGRPVITSDAGALPEVTKDGAGLCVPAGDYEALGEALIRVLTNPEMAETLSVLGRKKVEQLFSTKQFNPNFERLLTRVAAIRK